MNAQEMIDHNLTMDDINFAIKNAYGEQLSCVFSDYNDENLVFRIRMLNTNKKMLQSKSHLINLMKYICSKISKINFSTT